MSNDDGNRFTHMSKVVLQSKVDAKAYTEDIIFNVIYFKQH